MPQRFAIIVILSINVLVHSMDEPDSSFRENKPSFLKKIRKFLLPNKDENLRRITEGNTQGVPSTSSGDQIHLPHLVTPEMYQQLTQRYARYVNLYNNRKMTEPQFVNSMQRASNDIFGRIIGKNLELVNYENLLAARNRMRSIPSEEILYLSKQRDKVETERAQLIGEYNWLQKEHLNNPDGQLGLHSKIFKDPETGNNIIEITYLKRDPVKYRLDSSYI